MHQPISPFSFFLPDLTNVQVDLKNREKELSATPTVKETTIAVYFSDYCSLPLIF